MQETVRLALSNSLLQLILILIFSIRINAQVYPDTRVDSLLNSGIRNIVGQEYAAAESIFKKLKSEFFELPFGNIYLAANSIAMAFDYSEPYNEEFIRKNLDDAKILTNKLLAFDKNNIWHIYFSALVDGYVAYFEALNGSWLTAFSTGINSVSSFEKCLEIDEHFYESYIAIGTFAYWKSRKIEFLHWIPFIKDDREFGVNQLVKSINSSSYNSHLAMNSLIWIYIDQKDFNSAITLAQKALTDFPGSRLFKLGLARAYEDVDIEKSITAYYKILNSYPERPNNTRINEITLKHIIAQQYAKTGRVEQALELCDEILTAELSEYAMNRLEERLQRVRKLRSELIK